VSTDERIFLDELRKKSIEAAAEIMESLQRLKLLYDELTDDGSGNPLPRPKPGDFFYRLARFELEHASNIIRLGNSQAEMIFDHVRQLARRTKPGAASPTAVLVLAPTEKNHYVGAFEIKNAHDEEADARFEFTELRDSNGQALGKTPTAKPLRVGPHQTALVEVRLKRAAKDSTMFGELAVHLVSDMDRQVAKRAIKIRPEPPDSSP
jgi:hypothetical protein